MNKKEALLATLRGELVSQCKTCKEYVESIRTIKFGGKSLTYFICDHDTDEIKQTVWIEH